MHTNVNIGRAIRCAVLTVSDTRTTETDKGGQLVLQLLGEHNTHVTEACYKIVKDDISAIQSQVTTWLDEGVEVIITTGGTGIAQRDCTIEAVKPLLQKEIEGFGELFRYLSYAEDVGSRALLSRAIGGSIGTQLVFCLPGSTGAVTLGMKKLILPELNHLIHELNK
ncbi:molybdenum cofactor biosynthesis protein MoaB [Staphylococcus hyicus]|uniref:MogA/MoaB family molybdenum cofactor biosynthesis protein n=1 Tax=Staphylococcus hyicus TaxID=1284 RepID=UPI00057C4CD0|nr:molybdenum cofactor biosynthesis protein B [Staphylococcus hyicus]AJC95411.1 molybdenum cofactor biosynthesis protein B [Staphylococcus hyicus]MCE5153963.1 molybdenum cofactor biosynthesis protein MoaB [Staphylococcus hyicus]MCQ9291417.1 molybdenum cofactor biosynthesis protein MoaB [Staphylococcus hyicus]MCQ9300314.1 molybdenum cofactor biosynthesis protein MoaB [Staphylococcus hyicus]MCQ9306658.1 molybdenum cofactor biosynthesis protein MoaB [Staphylococcus hyicus]